jgi:biopolymer transport protein ExbD
MKLKTTQEAECNITSLIDCLMQCIIFFMMIMSAQYVYGVAIKFPSVSAAAQKTNQENKQEKDITVYVQADRIEKDHRLIAEGLLKVNGEERYISAPNADSATQAKQREQAYQWLEYKFYDLKKQGYKSDMVKIQGDMKTYHGKIMKVIDVAKGVDIKGFSLVPPTN